MTKVNMFVDMDTKLVKESSEKDETELVKGSEKRAGTELEQKVAKKQKIDDAKVDNDQEEARMKELMDIVPDEKEVAIDAIPLATKPPCIVDWKIIKEGKISQFQIIRANGSSKRYPLTPATITGMLNKKLQVDHWNEMWRIVGIKSFIRLFGITAALIKVSAAQEERVNAAGIKLQLLTELQLLMDKD
ncbi:hypothetical protein Tco_1123369 [Tanacetum coccineum]|uniref:Reverse transcriptase n=1 Tax=Tanacetum coccineum TaxID=301880 RepID=A0ABQ5J385_9ASTR